MVKTITNIIHIFCMCACVHVCVYAYVCMHVCVHAYVCMHVRDCVLLHKLCGYHISSNYVGSKLLFFMVSGKKLEIIEDYGRFFGLN